MYESKFLSIGYKLEYVIENNKPIIIASNDDNKFRFSVCNDYIGPSRCSAQKLGFPNSEVGNYLKESNIIGGYMIFPTALWIDYILKYDGNESIKYGTINKKRDGDSGFCDRFDCTLNDIKKYYEGGYNARYLLDQLSEINRKAKEKTLDSTEVMLGKPKLNDTYKLFKDWMNLFVNFEGFIDFFELNDFCDEQYRVYDLSSIDDNGVFTKILDDKLYLSKDFYNIQDKDVFTRYIRENQHAISSRHKRLEEYFLREFNRVNANSLDIVETANKSKELDEKKNILCKKFEKISTYSLTIFKVFILFNAFFTIVKFNLDKINNGDLNTTNLFSYLYFNDITNIINIILILCILGGVFASYLISSSRIRRILMSICLFISVSYNGTILVLNHIYNRLESTGTEIEWLNGVYDFTRANGLYLIILCFLLAVIPIILMERNKRCSCTINLFVRNVFCYLILLPISIQCLSSVIGALIWLVIAVVLYKKGQENQCTDCRRMYTFMKQKGTLISITEADVTRERVREHYNGKCSTETYTVPGYIEEYRVPYRCQCCGKIEVRIETKAKEKRFYDKLFKKNKFNVHN